MSKPEKTDYEKLSNEPEEGDDPSEGNKPEENPSEEEEKKDNAPLNPPEGELDPMLQIHDPDEGEPHSQEQGSEEEPLSGPDDDDEDDDDDLDDSDEAASPQQKAKDFEDAYGNEEEEEDSEIDLYSGDEDDEEEDKSDEEEHDEEDHEEEKPDEKLPEPMMMQAFEIEAKEPQGDINENQPLTQPLLFAGAPKNRMMILKAPEPQALAIQIQAKKADEVAKKPQEKKPEELTGIAKKMHELTKYDFGIEIKDKDTTEKQFVDTRPFWKRCCEGFGRCCKRGEDSKKKPEGPTLKKAEEPQKKPTAGKSEIERQFKRRVIVRYLFVVLIPLFLLAIFVALYFFTKKEENFRYEINEITDVNVNLTRCIMYLNQEPKDGEVWGNYAVSFSLMALFNETLEQSAALFNYDSELKQLNISVTSVKNNIKSCHLNLNLPSKLIGNLHVECVEKCYINQEYNTVEVDNFEIISEDDVYTNFRRISSKKLSMTADKGILQLNSFLIATSASINLNYGDVILQSESDIELNWKNQQQAFCFAAPSVANTPAELTDCAVSGIPGTADNSEKTTCGGKTLICETEGCTALTIFNVNQLIGNLYVNRVNEPFKDLEYQYDGKIQMNIVKGAIYDSGPALEPFLLAGLKDMKAQATDVATDSIFILQLGKKYLQSQGNSFWTVISNPSFAYIRPWWLATFSLSLLTANSFRVSGYLSPGLCPYHIEYNREDIYEVQNYLTSYFAINNSITSYIDEAYQAVPQWKHKNGTGFYDFEKDRPITEKWFSVFQNQEGQLDVSTNDINANGFILAALILSFVFAAFVGATVFMIFKAAVMITYKETWEKAMHTKNYVNFVKPKDDPSAKPKKKRINVAGILEESSFSNFMQQVPRLSAFVGFYSLNLVRKYFIDSVGEFLGFLMNPNLRTEYEKANKGIGEPRHLEMKESSLKNYYEKFCFLNGLTEKQLSDAENLKKFEEYGYELIDEVETQSKAFTRMQLIEEPADVEKATVMKSEDALDTFIKLCVRSTNAETDTEFLDEFAEKFNLFCDKYRLTRKEVRVEELTTGIKYKFGQTIIPRKKLVRKVKTVETNEPQKEEKFSFYEYFKTLGMKIVTFGQYVDKKNLRGKYLIDEEPLNYHFNIILKPEDPNLYLELEGNEKDLKEREKESKKTKVDVINKMIYHSYWYYWIMMDAFMIFIQQLVTAACILPFFMLVILQEITYAPYSIVDPTYLITQEDLMDNPWQIPGRIGFFNIWNIVIISICIFFMVYSFLDCLIYFCYARFPEDRSFEENQAIIKKNRLIKYLTNFQWLLIFFIVFCYASYVGLVCVWLLLGAIINPNNFLVYSTAAVTFLTFLSSKYQGFQKISDDGFKMIKDQVFKIIQGQIKNIMQFMIAEVKELTAIGKDMMSSDVGKFALEKAEALGLGDEIAALKNLGENPEKLVNNALSATNSFLEDPKASINKLMEAKDQLKDKAIQVFKTKCKSHNIPEELVDIFVSLNFKDEEKLKDGLALLVENKSYDVLGEKISRHLIKSILDLIIHPKNIKDPQELGRIVTQELTANLVEFFVLKALESYQEKHEKPEEAKVPEELALAPVKKSEKPLPQIKDFRELILSSFSLISNLKSRNSEGVIHDTRKIIKLLSLSSEENKGTEQVLELLEIIMTISNEAEYKQRILRFLYDNRLDEELFEFLVAVVFSSPEEQVQEIGKKKYTRSENIKPLIENMFGNNGAYKVKLPQAEFLGSLSSYAIKCIKNQVDGSDIEETAGTLNSFLNTIFKDGKINVSVPNKKELVKLLQVLPAMVYIGKDVASFWNGIAAKYEIEIDNIKELIMLMTENYWQNFVHKRYDKLNTSKIIPIIAEKLKMSAEELLGFIALFYGDLEEQSMIDFINSLLDYEKMSFPVIFQFHIREIVKIIFSNYNGFVIFSQLSKMSVNYEEVFNFLEKFNLIDDFTRSLFPKPPFFLINSENLDMNEEVKKQKEKINGETEKKESISDDEFLNALLKLMKIPEGQCSAIVEFLKRLTKLMSVKLISRTNVRRNIEIKNAVTQFAEKYNYDNDGLELLLYIMMGDFTHCVRGLQYFLESQTEFPFLSSPFKQIIRTILNEDRMMKASTFMKYVDKWIPNDEDFDVSDKDVLAKSFHMLYWYGFDVTGFARKLAVLGIEGKPVEDKSKKQDENRVKNFEELAKEEEEKKKADLWKAKANAMHRRVFNFFHLEEMTALYKESSGNAEIFDRLLESFFPIVAKDIQGTEKLEIDQEATEEVFEEQKDPREFLVDAETVQPEMLSKEEMKDFKDKFNKIFMNLVVRDLNISYSCSSIRKTFFSREKDLKAKQFIDWTDEKVVEKYVVLFNALNRSSDKTLEAEIQAVANTIDFGGNNSLNAANSKSRNIDFIKTALQTMGLNPSQHFDFSEVNRILKYFFTTDGDVFARGLIQNFNEFVGKLTELIDIFSICSLKPSIGSLSNVLGLTNSAELESSFNLCSFYSAQNLDEKLKVLQANDRWFKKLNIDFDEFSLLLKFLYNELDPYDFTKFMSAFSLNKQIHNKVLQSLFSLFAKTESFGEDFESFIKMSEDRAIIFKAIGIDNSFGDLICDVNEGNFYNLSKIIQCNKKLSQIKIFPPLEQNPKNIIETVSAFVGMVTNTTKLNLKLDDLYNKINGNTLKLGNNNESVAYLLYSQFKISPILTFLALDDKNAIYLAKKTNEILYHKITHIFQALDNMTITERNLLAEKEFLFEIDQRANDQFSIGKKDDSQKKSHFYNEIMGIRGLSRKNSNVSSSKNLAFKPKESEQPEEKEEDFKPKESEQPEEKEEDQGDENANLEYFSAYDYLMEMGKTLDDRLEEIYESLLKSKSLTDAPVYLNSKKSKWEKKAKNQKSPEEEVKEKQENKEENKEKDKEENKEEKEEEGEDYEGDQIDTYFDVIEVISDTNCLCAPADIQDEFRVDHHLLSMLLILSTLRRMRHLYSKKNEEVKEPTVEEKKVEQIKLDVNPEEKKIEDKKAKKDDKKNKIMADIEKKKAEEEKKRHASYKKMIEFGLNFDVLFSIAEKMKILTEEYQTFQGFDKNAVLKFFIPVFFFETIRDQKEEETGEKNEGEKKEGHEETEDFVLEFFFRNSLFEDDVTTEIEEKMRKKKKEKMSKVQKMCEILFESKLIPVYLAKDIDKNIELFLNAEGGYEKVRSYEGLKKLLDQDEGKPEDQRFMIPQYRRNFLTALIAWKNSNKERYEKHKFTSYEALEDYYPLEILANSGDITKIDQEIDYLEGEEVKCDKFFSASNYKQIREFPIFQRNIPFAKISDLVTNLSKSFRNFQMLKGESAREIFINLLILFKEKSKTSKKASLALETILAKISFNLKSNYNNLKMMLDFLLKRDMDFTDFDACLTKLDINPWVFFGLAIPHLKMSALLNSQKIPSSLFYANVPEVLMAYLKPYDAKKETKISKPPRTKNQRIRDLLQKSSFTKGQKDSLVLLINCFCGDKQSWKQMLFEMNLKGFSGNRDYRNFPENAKKIKDFEKRKAEYTEFLEVINLFSDSARRPFKASVLNSRSLAEFINPSTNYTKFISDLFEFTGKKLTSHDKNNLILIRALVEHNYEILLRLFNEAPLFMSRKLGVHHLSQRYFVLKIIMLCASLGNPYQQMNCSIPKYLENQLKDADSSIIVNILGVDKDFFSALCATEGGDFTQYIKYLSSKNTKFLPLASLFCWLNLPFVAHIYDRAKGSARDERKTISALLMYGFLNATSCFFSANSNKKQDLDKEMKHHLSLIEEHLKEHVRDALDNYMEEMSERDVQNVTWFSAELTDVWNGVNEDYCEIWLEQAKAKNKEVELDVLAKKFKASFVDTVYQKALNAVKTYVETQYLRENQQDDNQKFYEPIFKFFPLLLFANSGLAKLGTLDGLIEEVFDDGDNKDKPKPDIIETMFSGLLLKEGKETDKKQIMIKDRIFAQKNSLKLIMIGFEILEKQKIGTDSKSKELINRLLQEMLMKKNDVMSLIMLEMISMTFSNNVSLVDKKTLGKLFIILISQIVIRLINQPQVTVDQKELDEYLQLFEEKKDENGNFSKEFIEEKRNEYIKSKKMSEEWNTSEKIQECFAGINESPEKIVDLIEDIVEFIEQYQSNSTEIKKQQIQDIALSLGEILFPSQKETQAIIESIFNFINGDFDKLSPELFNLFNIDKKTFLIIKGFLEEFKLLMQGPEAYVNKKITFLTSSLTGEVSSLNLIKDKLNMDKDMDTKDLFKVFDSDNSGKISLDEFKLLTKRLNMTLSDHRIKEIFTSVKGEEINYSQELNDKEFEKALNYLQEKSIMLTLEYLGITKEILFGLLIWLTLLLLILFAFIFVGIAAFAIGGTFGSIINSMFPVAGGAGLGSKGEDKKSSLNMEKLKEQVEKCVNIVQSFKI